jgi:hypothetical protein
MKMSLAVTNFTFAPTETVQLNSHHHHSVFSQEPVTDTCLEPDESRPRRHNKFFEIQINVIFPSKSPMWPPHLMLFIPLYSSVIYFLAVRNT